MANPIDLDNQSIEIAPGVRTSCLLPDGKVENIPTYLFEDAKTCYESFLRGIRVSNNGPFLGQRSGPNQEYTWISYKEVHDRALRLGSALAFKGCGKGDIVGIFGSNSVGWVVTDIACAAFSLVSVPLYDTLGKEAITHILTQTEMPIIVVGEQAKVKSLLQDEANTKFLKLIVLMEEINDDTRKEADKHGVEMVTLDDMIEIGSNNLRDAEPPKPSDLHTICYTSGTTGNPKGVMLSHENLISNIAGILTNIGVAIGPEDVHISYLPLAHMFERGSQILVHMNGGQIGFFGGDIRKLTEDFASLRPTIVMSVPRLLNRIYDKVLQGVQKSMIKSFLFNVARNRKTALLRSGTVANNTIWDKLVFGKIQALFGGRVRIMVCGSAPLGANVIDFYRVALGCMFLEGYGQSEVTAGATFQLPNETNGGHVGPPMNCNIVKLIDVPDMDYFVKDNKGEVCIKGPSVMLGYFKDEERTREAIDSEGWIHSGDIGEWLPNGTLKIIDRRKHIFKLSQGEYVAPERLENIYNRSQYIAQMFVDGRSSESYPVAIVVPDPEVVSDLAQSLGVNGDMKDICQSPDVKAAILKDTLKFGKEADVKGFEQIKDIYLHPEPFSVENGLLTPTFKSKRPQLRKFFSDEIDQMYENIGKLQS